MKVHFIGIGGTGMGALAALLKAAGHDVRGSDTTLYPPMSTQLAEAEITVMSGFDPANVGWGPDAVVVGNVCSKDHPEVVAAEKLGLQLESFPSLLAKTLLEDRDPLVVAGTHGKTTTGAALSWLLQYAGRDPTFLIGGVPLNIGRGSHLGTGSAIVIEGDEYDTAFFDKGSKFLHYRPRRAVLTSVEFDHADIFAGLEDVRATFRKFVETIPADGDLIVHLDDSEAMGIAASARCKVLTYHLLPDRDTDTSSADYCAIRASRSGARRTVFEVFEHGESLGEFSTGLVGRFNVANLLAAIAVARREGVGADELRAGVRKFRGVRRRQELVGVAQGVRVIEDFAHHPTAVQLAVTALRRRYPEHALHVCFEPRSASSRRAAFMEGYAASFDAADRLYIGPLYSPEKIPERERLDPQRLATAVRARGVKAQAYEGVEALAAEVLEQAVPGDTVVSLSSGAFGDLPRRVLYGFGDPLMFADAEDRAAVDGLLGSYALPPVATSPDIETLVIRSRPGDSLAVVGCVSLEVKGDCAYLFGLGVRQERRGEGLGWILGDAVLRRARTLGARVVYLNTTSAADFFASKLGFSRVDHDLVDADVRGSENFRRWSSMENSVCMVCELPPDGNGRPQPS